MNQMSSQWCWAASISMVYAYYGHPVSQARIVSSVYGSPENIPAMSGFVIANELDRCWVDDSGAAFNSAVTGVYDANAGVFALTDDQIVSELDQDRPLVLGARTHAMVLTAIRYYQTSSGPYIVGAGVFDPWPGVGPRELAMDELYPLHTGGSLRFLATIQVTDLPSPDACAGSPPPFTPASPPPFTPAMTPGGCNAGTTPRGTHFFLLLSAIALIAARRARRSQDTSSTANAGNRP